MDHGHQSPPPAGARGTTAATGAADGPTELPKSSWWSVLKRTASEYSEDNLSDWAAALTYYAVLSIFPALLALVSVLGLLGSGTIDPLLKNLGDLAPGAARDLITSALQQVRGGPGKAGLALVISTALALWSASGYVAGFMRAANAVYDIREGRPAWKTLPTRFAITLALVVLFALTAIGVVFTGTLAQRAGEVIGLGDTALTVWNIAKWPVLLLLVSLMIALLYWASPNVKQPGFRWVTPGSLLAVVIWLIASAAFAFYVANFGSYNKTYGSFAAVIIFLIWLWISNIAILLGIEFNAELERSHAIQAGHPPEEEPYVEPRDTRKLPESDIPPERGHSGGNDTRSEPGPDAKDTSPQPGHAGPEPGRAGPEPGRTGSDIPPERGPTAPDA